jgi:hypothetical protein
VTDLILQGKVEDLIKVEFQITSHWDWAYKSEPHQNKHCLTQSLFVCAEARCDNLG